MNTAEIMNYLKPLIEMEKNRYMQETVIRQLNYQIQSFKNSKTPLNPQALNMVDSRTFDKSTVKIGKKGIVIMIFVIYCMIVWSVMADKMIYEITHNIPLTAIVSIIGIIISILIPVLIRKLVLTKKQESSYVAFGIQAAADKHWITEKQKENNILDKKIESALTQKDVMQQTLNNTLSALQKYYAPDIIPAEYRSFVPVCMFYDYLSKGRTYTIRRDGSDPGAVNIYEEDLKFKKIMNRLDEINNYLINIRKNQEILYEAIESGNRRTHELLTNINSNISNFRSDVNKNMNVIKYQNEQIAKNTEYVSYVTYQNYMSR